MLLLTMTFERFKAEMTALFPHLAGDDVHLRELWHSAHALHHQCAAELAAEEAAREAMKQQVKP